MAQYEIGDLVVLKSGSMRMTVEQVESDAVAVVWCHEGQIGRERFDTRLLNKWEYREDQLDGVLLAVAATDDEGLNASLVEAANRRGILVCDASSSRAASVIAAIRKKRTGKGPERASHVDSPCPRKSRSPLARIPGGPHRSRG